MNHPIRYRLPSPTVFSKNYNKDTLFEDVAWSSWQTVVDGFRSRFVGWYFDPLAAFPQTGHEAYPVLCSMCALVDAFTHYDGTEEWHSPRQYKHFLRSLAPGFATKLTSRIKVSARRGEAWTKQYLKDYADVFYTGVRCSLHHHGDLAPFAGMSGTGVLATEFPNACLAADGSEECSIVVFDPWVVRSELERWFHEYCCDLQENPDSGRAQRFRERLAQDFVVSVASPR